MDYEVMLSLFNYSAYILIVFIIISILAAIILTLVESHFKKKLRSFETRAETVYISGLDRIMKSKNANEEKLDSISIVAKKFFHEFFGLDLRLSYSELVDEFKEKGEISLVQFCEIMLLQYYSGEKLTNEKIREIAKKLEGIIRKSKRVGIQKPKQEEKPTPLFDNSIAEFALYKKEAEIVLRTMLSDKNVERLSKKEAIDTEELSKVNPKAISDIQKISSFLKKAHEVFKELFGKVYKNATEEQKQKLRAMIDKWKEEQKEILEWNKNPIKQQILKLKIIDRYFKNFQNIAAGKMRGIL